MIFKYRKYIPLTRTYETTSTYLNFCSKLDYLTQIHTELTENKLINCEMLDLSSNNSDFNNSYEHQISHIRNNKRYTCGKLFRLIHEERNLKHSPNSLSDFLNLRWAQQPRWEQQPPLPVAADIQANQPANAPANTAQGTQGARTNPAEYWYMPLQTNITVGATGTNTRYYHTAFTTRNRNGI